MELLFFIGLDYKLTLRAMVIALFSKDKVGFTPPYSFIAKSHRNLPHHAQY